LPATIPAGAVTAEDAMLIARLAAHGTVRIHLTLTSHAGPEVKSYNVIADLKGSERPEQIVVVSGHLDSWDLGTGALDDGAGVATAMETAEILQSLHLRPKRTLRVIAWMDEERDGRGHDAYAAEHHNEFGHYSAALESDSGAGHPLGFDVSMSAAALSQLRPVAAVLQPIGANLLQMVDNSPEADIAPMSEQGVPVLGLMQDTRAYFRYHHTAADTLDKVDPQQLKQCAAAMAVMSYALAEIPDPLAR
jgi:carboxypeptidase Q